MISRKARQARKGDVDSFARWRSLRDSPTPQRPEQCLVVYRFAQKNSQEDRKTRRSLVFSSWLPVFLFKSIHYPAGEVRARGEDPASVAVEAADARRMPCTFSDTLGTCEQCLVRGREEPSPRRGNHDRSRAPARFPSAGRRGFARWNPLPPPPLHHRREEEMDVMVFHGAARRECASRLAEQTEPLDVSVFRCALSQRAPLPAAWSPVKIAEMAPPARARPGRMAIVVPLPRLR
jgi:hypothetical protein